jgi:hypothetical protein
VSEILDKERESDSDALDTLLVQRRADYSVFEAILLLLSLLLFVIIIIVIIIIIIIVIITTTTRS